MRTSSCRVPAPAALILVSAAVAAAAACASTRHRAGTTPAPSVATTPAPSDATPTSPSAVTSPPSPASLSPARAVIAEMKAYQARVGFTPTGNFAAPTSEPFPGRCYYTGTLELPESYQALHMVAAVNGRCRLDESEYDVFPYALETAATGSSAVTPALEGATLERLLMVVPHEDFHNQPEARRAPAAAAEAAAMLAGFVTAAGFARERYGPDAPVAQHLAAESMLFASKAAIVNRFADQVARLFADYHAGRVPREQALARKRQLYDELGQACMGSGPAPVSFNRCPAVLNNAGLAFDWTYTRDYPRLFELDSRLGDDVAQTIAALKRLLAAWPDRAQRAAPSPGDAESVNPGRHDSAPRANALRPVRDRTGGTSGSADR